MSENTIKSYRIVKGKWKSVDEKLLSAEKKDFPTTKRKRNNEISNHMKQQNIYSKEKKNQTQRT